MRTVLLSAILAIATVAPGQCSIVIGLWEFDGTDTAPVTVQATGLANSNLTMTGLTAATGNSLFFSAIDWSVGAYSSQFFEWTVTPNPGYTVDYTTAALEYVIGTNPVFTHEIRSSVDGFSSAISSHVSSPGTPTYGDSLAALGLQTGAVTFRLYGQVDEVAGQSGFYSGSMRIQADDGAVYSSVPEPASLGLFAGLLSLALITVKRSPVCLRLLRNSR